MRYRREHKKAKIGSLLLLLLLLTGCGEKNSSVEHLENVELTSKPHVVHISSSENIVPEEEVPISTRIDWEEILSITIANLPDVEAVKGVLPEPVTILDYRTGDLGLDGVEDVVIVYEYPETVGYELACRTLAVFSGKKDYECLAFHETLIMDSESGGTVGDPYQYTEIADNGELHISFYGGSAWRWGYDLWFELVDEALCMYRFVDSYSYSLTGDVVELTHNFREQRTSCDAYWYADDINYALLYEYCWPMEVEPLMFAEICGIEDLGQERIPHMDVPLPIYDTFYSNMDMRGRLADFSAENVLDAVKEASYPEMEKVMYDTDVIYLDDISAFMGYEMPAYYYESENGVRLYYRTASFDADTGWTHEICLTGDGVYETILHRE